MDITIWTYLGFVLLILLLFVYQDTMWYTQELLGLKISRLSKNLTKKETGREKLIME